MVYGLSDVETNHIELKFDATAVDSSLLQVNLWACTYCELLQSTYYFFFPYLCFFFHPSSLLKPLFLMLLANILNFPIYFFSTFFITLSWNKIQLFILSFFMLILSKMSNLDSTEKTFVFSDAKDTKSSLSPNFF